jgi:hypothetical protein
VKNKFSEMLRSVSLARVTIATATASAEANAVARACRVVRPTVYLPIAIQSRAINSGGIGGCTVSRLHGIARNGRSNSSSSSASEGIGGTTPPPSLAATWASRLAVLAAGVAAYLLWARGSGDDASTKERSVLTLPAPAALVSACRVLLTSLVWSLRQ